MRKRLILLLLAAAFFTLVLSALTAHAMPDSALKIGSKGPDVKELQQKLAENGVLEEKYVTGFFGPATEEAVFLYQKKNNIKQTGVAAEKTLESLFVKKDIDGTMVLKKDMESGEVKTLQEKLAEMGYLSNDNVTGYYGDKTEAAVKKFQKEHDISPTGVAAKLTIEKINELSNITKLSTDRTYKSGDEDAGVKALQQRLSQLGYLDEKYVTGYYGAITVSAVKKFQKNNQISQTGTVANLTLAALNSAAAKINKEEKTVTAVSGDSIAKPGTLRQGDTGSQVKKLQQDLKKLGYFSGTATGEFGSVTKKAVMAFQKAYSISADGIAGSKTLSKISAALSAKNNSSSGSTTTGTTVSGYNSANMDLINSALASLSESQLNDIKLMARIIKREVGGSSYKCQLAVGSVIMNRVKRTGASVHDIIYSPKQFSTANSTLANETYSTSNFYAAVEAYMGVKPVGNCLYFCSVSARYTCWAGKNRTYYTTLGNECFFL